MTIWVSIVLLSIAHVCSIHRPHRWLYYTSKPAPILLLIGALLLSDTVSNAYSQFIVLGLLLSVLGDILLMLPKERFIAGLTFSLVSHLFYFSAFAGQITITFSPWLIAALLLIGVAVYRLIGNNLQSAAVPVVSYLIVILLMTWSATEYRAMGYNQSSAFAFTGAILFLLSYFVFAIDRFRESSRYSRQVVMITYYTAQIFIALSAFTY
ncbi:lysoplasmalogenase [uncultured Vibrio sp.]|uniref:lysoplasmalogenase n=1 Tax=uncultured Vibrio sp. TaxID=114054 RepID=UPI0025FCEA56|nr:lysoplasmalogenase [uncultured Vibrio sp.]